MKSTSAFTILESLVVLGILTVMTFVIIALGMKKTQPTFSPLPPSSPASVEGTSGS